jgi:hypothetical protein
MASLSITGGRLRIRLTFTEKIFSLHGDFSISGSDIVSAKPVKAKLWAKELRVPGTFFPWLIKAGTYVSLSGNGRSFWFSRWRGGHIQIELRNHWYKRIVLSLDDPAYWSRKIRRIQRKRK